MESFKKVLQKRLALMVTFNVLSAGFILLTGALGNMAASGSESLTGMIQGFQIGIFVGLQIMVLVYISKYVKALKKEDVLRKLYVEENDERRRLIQDKIGGAGFNFVLGVIATATVISGFYHQIVFATLLGVLIFIVHVKAVLKIYYRNKF